MAGDIFRKTEAGLAALRAHGALEPRLRTMLVLVNGRQSVDALRAQLGIDPRDTLRLLQAQGLIERARAAMPAAGPPPPAPAPAAADPAADEAAALRRRQTQALDLLLRNFGPSADELAAPLLQARTLAAFGQALGPLQERLAVYQGKRRAAALIEGLTS